MDSITGTKRAAALLYSIVAAAVFCVATQDASADTVRTVNGAAIDSAVLDFYIRNRTQRAPEQITAEQREQLLDELTDIYLLSTQEIAEELANDPQMRAQIELQRRGALAQAVATRFLANATVSDEEVQAEYASQRELAPPLQFKARHILVESQGEAAAIIDRLDAGADFAELARTESTGPSAPNGGDLDWFSPNQMVEPFSNAVSALEDGGYTAEPVQTQFGWHVILREDSREAEAPPLESVRERIQQELVQRKFQAYLSDLRQAQLSTE